MAGNRGLAEEVRTGLEEAVLSRKTYEAAPINPLDELYYRRPIREHVKDFGSLFCLIFIITSGFFLYHEKPLSLVLISSTVGMLFYILGYSTPKILYPIWNGWMKFAHVLGLIVTTLILSLTWIIAVCPIALTARLFGAKSMDLTFKENVPTYWVTKAPESWNFKLLERQF